MTEQINTVVGKLYISMTVMPERLQSSFFKEVIGHLKQQTMAFDKIIVNVPHIYKRTGEHYVVPGWLEEDAQVLIHRCEDMGPATKLLGYYDQLQPDDMICVVDDDIIYLPHTLDTLYRVHAHYPGSVVSSTLDETNAPTGYGGYLFQRKTLEITVEDIDDLLENCYCVDDTWLGKMIRVKGIRLVGVSKNWLFTMDREKTDTHPQWFELGKHTDRYALIRKCLCSQSKAR